MDLTVEQVLKSRMLAYPSKSWICAHFGRGLRHDLRFGGQGQEDLFKPAWVLAA